ncbi:hypothetical protein A176_007138 [Myxococcus hansupus]|uniref:Uncharacterized protein n=1 Tax=Pseudomyxococcus hansupus TaxID=1297742 RepID=A0A0H4X3I3_9BACT|nr:hypothetical protein A176_007138 [Myxococcus hansupus]
MPAARNELHASDGPAAPKQGETRVSSPTARNELHAFSESAAPTSGAQAKSLTARNELHAFSESAAPTSEAPAKPLTARNELHAFAGPSSRAAAPPTRSPPPESAGPAVSAGELTALGGRLRPPGSKHLPEEVFQGIRTHLTRSLTDWTVSAADVRAVHGALGALPPGPYRAALERMERDGLLRTYVNAQDAGSRRAFLEQAEGKGMLQRNKGETSPVDALGYPAVPDFFVNDARLPRAMRDAVNAHAIDVGVGFYKAHGEYLVRYALAVDQAGSRRELGALGPPRAAQLSESVLGLEWKDPARKDYEAAWKAGIGRPKSLNLTYQHLTARERELSGERGAGTVRLQGKVGAGSETAQWALKGSLDTRGQRELKGEAGVTVRSGPMKLELSQDTAGKKEATVKLDLGLVEFSLDSGGAQRVAVGIGKALQVQATLNPRKAEFEGGLSAKVKADGDQAGVEVGFSMKGLSAQRARQAVDRGHRGVFQQPAELESRMAWDTLPPATRAAYAKEGWSRELWTQALPR